MNRYIRWIAGVFAAFLLGGSSVFALTPQTAYADDRCQAYVVDDANIFGAQKDAVAAAAKSLETVGAEGRAITIQTFGNAGTVDTYIDRMAQSCPEWQMSGTLKQNFFAAIISMQERKVAIYYGKQWKSRFDIEAPNIQSKVMAPKFQQGKFADGFIAAFDKIKQVIQAPAAPSGGGGVPGNPAPAQPAPSAPFNWSIVWIVVGGFVGVVLLILLIWLVIVPWAGELYQLKKLRDKVVALRDQCVKELARLKVDIDKPEYIDWFEDFAVVGGDIQSQAKNSRAKAQQSVVDAEQKMREAEKIGDLKLHLGESKYIGLQKAYGLVLKSLTSAREGLDSIDGLHSGLIHDANAASDEVNVLDAKITTANTTLLGVSQTGLDTSSLGAKLESASDEVKQYRGLRDASALVLIAELPRLQALVTDCESVIQECQSDLDTYNGLLVSLPTLHQAAVDKRPEAGAAFQRMSSQYAPSSWENIAGNGSKADQLLFRAKEMLDQVTAEPLKDVAQLKERLERCAKISTMISDGAALHDAIIAREHDIVEAQRTADQEIARAESDINKAVAYIHQYPKDVDQNLDGALDKARRYLDNARKELALEKPNYLVVVKQALLANGAADAVLAEAVEEHEYLESVRQQLETARTLFATSSDKSDRYIANNRSDVSKDADKLLRKARDLFARVAKQSDEVSMLKVAKQALELANDAYDKASADVTAAEAAREAVRAAERAKEEAKRRKREREEEEERQRQQTYYHSTTVYTSPSHSSSYDSGSSISSSFDFGGSSGSSGW